MHKPLSHKYNFSLVFITPELLFYFHYLHVTFKIVSFVHFLCKFAHFCVVMTLTIKHVTIVLRAITFEATEEEYFLVV
jgi:hypothetical protein